VSHTPAIGAKDKVARTAVLALAAGNRCGTKPGDSFSQPGIGNFAAHFNHRARKLMPKNHRGVVAKRIVKNMEIRPADPTIGDFQLYFAVSTTRLLNLPYFDVSIATCILNQSFHVGGSLNRVQLTTAIKAGL
jgi:hypothetical protein